MPRSWLAKCAIAIGVSLAWLLLAWEWRTVTKRFSLGGFEPAEVTIVRYHSILAGTTSFQIEYPNGATTKLWLEAHETSIEEILEQCKVEYDGETLCVLGPGDEYLEVAGFLLPRAEP